MPHRPYRSLLVVLLDLALLKPGLVLMRGKDYWRIEDIAKKARRDAHSRFQETSQFLSDERYLWVNGDDGKVVVLQNDGDQDVPFAVEPGSEIAVPA